MKRYRVHPTKYPKWPSPYTKPALQQSREGASDKYDRANLIDDVASVREALIWVKWNLEENKPVKAAQYVQTALKYLRHVEEAVKK